MYEGDTMNIFKRFWDWLSGYAQDSKDNDDINAWWYALDLGEKRQIHDKYRKEHVNY